jgi:ABC-type Na+ efflux pump permease subunit
VLGSHYPSDVVGSFLLCGFWASLAGVLLDACPGRVAVSARGLALAGLMAAGALAAAVALAERHPAAVTTVRSSPLVVGTGLAFGAFSVAVFGLLAPLLGERPLGEGARTSLDAAA